ncbi:MATE efflux family protein DTX1 [Hordeum vulgare]|nr:MATE efflux family protein DTX1 [Hordeum vulgare]
MMWSFFVTPTYGAAHCPQDFGHLRPRVWPLDQLPQVLCNPDPVHAGGGRGGGHALELSGLCLSDQYLGLPLSIRKVSSTSLMPLVGRLVCKLASWKASLLSCGERLALVRHVLFAMLVHILIAMVLNPTILKLVRRIIRVFLWQGCKDAKDGYCMVNWAKVCRQLQFGGLAIRDLSRTALASGGSRFRRRIPRDPGATCVSCASPRFSRSSVPLHPGPWVMEGNADSRSTHGSRDAPLRRSCLS